MPNPSGQNSAVNFNGLVQNPPVYGDKQKQGDLARTAPIAGGPASASMLNSARRAKNQATSPSPSPQAVQGQSQTAQAPSYQAQLAQAWAEVAAIPGASPLVQSLAQEAQVG